MEILLVVAAIAIYKWYDYCKKNRSVGILDWEKLKYYKYYKCLPDSEIRQLMNKGFFTDWEATRKFREKNKH
ncbi:hypothetical protein [Clostridium sp. AF32-12BH]|uniref:hypothetical protein n=1 Tax=Clostridium sp. AF32-12BH TaxID=2292006 RepID=UPI000E47CF6A|nr:hypothetical protein [Clostridium sp. AF32-12BH]RHP47002.1 hypothetical protein DWZ40_08850 [Clostridium sp. AF32-12BH]